MRAEGKIGQGWGHTPREVFTRNSHRAARSPVVAVRYAMSDHSLLFKVVASSFMQRGADIRFLSAFPSEKEFVYPPLTYLQPTGKKETIDVAAGEVSEDSPRAVITVIEVEPHVV